MVVVVLGVALLVGCTSDDRDPTPAPTGTRSASSSPATAPARDVLSLFDDEAPVAGSGQGGKAVVAVPGEATVLDPFTDAGDTPATRDLAALWLPGLWRIRDDGVRTPWLAAGPPRLTPDGRRVIVDLRADARWSDGSRITSADIAATWRRAAGSPGPFQRDYQVLAGVETPTPSRAVLVLREPTVAWTRLFVAPTGVLPAARIANLGRHAYDLSVTGGPFALAGRTPGLDIRWRRTRAPWPGSDPVLDELVVQVVPDFDTACELLRAGKLDAVAPYSAVNAAARLAEAGARASAAPSGARPTVLVLDTTAPLLRDMRVRQAMAQALDRSVFAEALLRSGGAAVDDVVRDGAAGARDPFRRWRRDVPAARRLLDAAGWRTNGDRPRRKDGAELTLVLTTASPSDLDDVAIRGIQLQLREIGMQLDLAATDAPRSAELARTGFADLALTRWELDVVPDLRRQLGWARWSDAEGERLLRQVAAADDLRALGTATGLAAARLAAQVPVLPLYDVYPVTGARGITVAAPGTGAAGPFRDVHRWHR